MFGWPSECRAAWISVACCFRHAPPRQLCWSRVVDKWINTRRHTHPRPTTCYSLSRRRWLFIIDGGGKARVFKKEEKTDVSDAISRRRVTTTVDVMSEDTAVTGSGGSVASRRERLRRPLPNPPDSNRGSSGGGGGGSNNTAAAAAGVRGVVASRLAAMASAGSSTSSSVTAASAGSSSPASTATTNGSDLPHKLSTSYSVDSNSRIPSYRLSSLDRLAQRQRLFEATTATSVQPNGLPTAHPPPPPTTAATTTTYAAAGETHGVSLLHYPVSYVSLVTWDDDTPFWPLGRPGCHAEPLSFSLFRMTADAPALRMRRTTTTTTIPRRRRRLVVTVVVVVYHRCAHPQPCTTTTGALIDLFTWPKKKKKKQSSSCGGSFAFSYSFHFVFHRRTLKAIHSIYLSLFRSLVGWGPLVIWESLRIWNYYTLYTRKIDAPRRVVNHSSAD